MHRVSNSLFEIFSKYIYSEWDKQTNWTIAVTCWSFLLIWIEPKCGITSWHSPRTFAQYISSFTFLFVTPLYDYLFVHLFVCPHACLCFFSIWLLSVFSSVLMIALLSVCSWCVFQFVFLYICLSILLFVCLCHIYHIQVD